MSNLRTRLSCVVVATVLVTALAAFAVSASAGDILDQWDNIQLPPRPELKPVTLQGPTTALLILDMLTNQCAPTSRCAATVPTIKRLHDAARAAGAMVWYSMPGANTMPADIVDPALTPHDGEWERVSGPDKFMFSSLDEKLKAHGVKAIIVCGHSFQGVGIGTGSASAERGYQVIIPVDCLSSGDNYGEQYAAWHMYKGGPNTVISRTTLTRSTMIKF